MTSSSVKSSGTKTQKLRRSLIKHAVSTLPDYDENKPAVLEQRDLEFLAAETKSDVDFVREAL